MSVSVYTVKGMTCEHCAKSVTSELGAVPGVSDVQVDLPTGQVTATVDGSTDDEAVRAAVGEAGYEVVR
ncbi:MAG: heavy-metal-associated domain-containing protein [Actinomycetota bacterium]|nr:heavy-metal-associated domain-containing protein [Actinomycetota bacterium]